MDYNEYTFFRVTRNNDIQIYHILIKHNVKTKFRPH